MASKKNLDELILTIVDSVEKGDVEFYKQLYDSFQEITKNSSQDLTEYNLCVEAGMLSLDILLPGLGVKKQGIDYMKKKYQLIKNQ